MKSHARHWNVVCLPLCVVGLVVTLVTWASSSPVEKSPPPLTITEDDTFTDTVQQVNQFFESQWTEKETPPAATASELTQLRRLSLALHGTVPSLEEIREYESLQGTNRLERWTQKLLADRRFADYFSERLTRAFVGVAQGQFIIFRRDRFKAWLSDQIQDNTPYDELVRKLIAGEGLWTGDPETNFITAAVADGNLDRNKLTGSTVRAFLGQRIDCAQCHDHPFDHWKQTDFEGLTAFYGQVEVQVLGVRSNRKLKYEVEDRMTLEQREVSPRVPFLAECLPAEGTLRERLAEWVTHPDNRRFERASANRVWGLLFGIPYYDPVDDLPAPTDLSQSPPGLLDILGRDFRENGYDIKRLIQIIVASRPFQLSSESEFATAEQIDAATYNWALFPLVRLRPEQIIGSMLQASSLKTIDQNSNLIMRGRRFFSELNFVKEYGDLGSDELNDFPGTIPQALLRMNGEFAKDNGSASPLNSVGRIASLDVSTEKRIETCYLVCLTRLPTPAERDYFLKQYQSANNQQQRVKITEDLYWALYNSPEFSWNH
ncbi:DUF1549 domain-containing protein [Gimesia sp.]|uniref:DUF1549 domain-containing protein n=1 Tax=Gimesia sp. TaxID=2024833 RepID=UPI000C35A38A|nr:DUF1549 domain-containing protein [Gimesia sp.]MAX39146.1 hypothetical protein [Gimesia sp.]HAH44023.1 hypothetical protein [Planctomycetaceae bacterium]HBL45244.1 hypothetical protein [Planctomycetaceae bacterium]|tara:strand:+ start:21933 stop:23570 length:1638 start_codon:yes stop_codon:yes gene_type:complete